MITCRLEILGLVSKLRRVDSVILTKMLLIAADHLSCHNNDHQHHTDLVIYMTSMLMMLIKIDLQDFVFSTTRLSRLRRGNLEKESLPNNSNTADTFYDFHCDLGE